MKNNSLIAGALIFFVFGSLNCAIPTKGEHEHLVQDHISTLRTQLASTNISYEHRKKLESYLRRYFDSELYGQHSELKPLDKDTQKIANSIISSYQDILKTPGNHKQAAMNFALQAGGLVAYHTNPKKATKRASKGGVTPSRASEKPGTKQVSTEQKPKGWMEEAESLLFGKKSEQPTETKPAVAQSAAKTTTAKPVVKPIEKTQMASEKTTKAKKQAGKKHKKKTEKEKKEKRAKKQAKKAKKEKMKAQEATVQ